MYGMFYGFVGYSSSFRVDLVGILLGEGCGLGVFSKFDLMLSLWDFCIYIVYVNEVVVIIVCYIVY